MQARGALMMEHRLIERAMALMERAIKLMNRLLERLEPDHSVGS